MPNKRSGGRVLVDGLVAGGVKHVFCVPGESYLAALDAFHHHRRRVRLITCRQEGGAAYMTEAAGKLTGRPGVAFVSRAPGAANAMVGVHTAFQDSTPMLLFVGQNPRDERGREAFQELDYRRVYAGVAKSVLRVDDAADILNKLCAAWSAAVNDRPGPVVVELPEDMLRDEVTVADVAMPVRTVKKPTADAVVKFAELLKNSARPLIIFGGAAWTPATNGLLAAFCSKHRVPAACAFRRQDMMDNTHANFVGELGVAPNPALVKLVKESDLIIALAARLGEMTSDGYTLFNVPAFSAGGEQTLVHVFPSAKELNSVYHADLGVDCDAEEFLRAAAGVTVTERPDRVTAARQNYLDFVNQPRDTDAPLRMDKVMEFLREHLPADTIVTNGAGNYTAWAQRNWRFTKPKTQLAATNGSMGYGVPAAVAAKVLSPAATVLSVNGDGCFLMNGQELATAAQYRLGVLFLIVNNRCYGTIRTHQQRHHPGRAIATDLVNPDFAAAARAYNAFGATVTHTAAFEVAFDGAMQATADGTPAVIDLHTEQ